MTQPVIAVDMARAARLSGISERTLRHWESQGIFSASYIDPSPRVPFRRIYSFRDLVSLRALGQIRRQLGVSLQEIKRAGDYLSQFYESPWSELRFGVLNKRLVFRDPKSGKWIGGTGQGVLELDMKDIPQEIERQLPSIAERDPSMHGEITRNRYVHQNKHIIAGTRIPTSTIWVFHEDGYTNEQIQDEFPYLTAADIEVAIAFERNRRKAA